VLVVVVVVVRIYNKIPVVEQIQFKEETRLNAEDPGKNKGLFITYHTEPGASSSLGDSNVVPWTCDGTNAGLDDNSRVLLQPVLRSYFNFTTMIQTNLKILVMGDSVGLQLSEYLQSVLRRPVEDNMHSINATTTAATTIPSSPAVLKLAYGTGRNAPAIHVTAPLALDETIDKHSGSVSGSGAIAGWRLVGMFLPGSLGWAQANWNHGWLLEDVESLRGYVSNATSKTLEHTTSQKNITIVKKNRTKNVVVSSEVSGNFDVYIFRISSPSWIPFEDVTEETLQTTIKLANQLFGVQVVVFVSMHYCNNVESQQMREELNRRNQMVSRFSENWTETMYHRRNSDEWDSKGDRGVHTVYFFDQGRLNDKLMEANAQLLGFDTTSSVYTDIKLEKTRKSSVDRTVGQICAEKVPHGSKDCIRNAVSMDGMHMCMNIVGPRLVAGLACQLQCAYQEEESKINGMIGGPSSWFCAEACNDKYMNLTAMV